MSNAHAIPRYLHYMYLTPRGRPPRPTTLSAAYHFWLTSCARANPKFRILLWDRDDCTRLVESSHPTYASWFAHNLSAMGVIRQADFCRLMVLATYGGVYLDFDFRCERPLDPLLNLPLFAADEPAAHKRQWRRRPQSLFPCNAIMGSQPHHPLWAAVMQTFRDRCERWEARHPSHPDGQTAPVMTGPHMIAPVWRKYAASRAAALLAQQRSPGHERASLPVPPDIVLVPTVTFYPVPALIERGRAFGAPRDYPNATLAAHQWGSFYTARGTLHELGREPMPAFVGRPAHADVRL